MTTHYRIQNQGDMTIPTTQHITRHAHCCSPPTFVDPSASKMAKLYDKGTSILELSATYDFPPVVSPLPRASVLCHDLTACVSAELVPSHSLRPWFREQEGS
jgi:hypothetical protein